MYTNAVTNHAGQQAKLEIDQPKRGDLERRNFRVFFTLENKPPLVDLLASRKATIASERLCV